MGSGNPASTELYAQKFDGDGNCLWGGYGVPVSIGPGGQGWGEAIPDEEDGIIVVWEDCQNNWDSYLHAQHLDENGDPLWQINGIPLYYPGTSYQMWGDGLGNAVSDGQGSGIWDFLTPGTYNTLQLFRLTGEGRVLWFWISNFGTRFLAPNLLRHPADGMVWFSDLGDLHRFDVNGNPLFGQAGLDNLGGCLTPTSNGVISFALQGLTHGTRLYARRITMEGSPTWTTNVALGQNPGGGYAFTYPVLTSDANDGAVVAFEDWRNPATYPDISAQRVLWYGQLSNPPLPKIPISGNLQSLSTPAAGSLRLALPQTGEIKLDLFDLLGRRVAVLKEGYFPPGDYTVRLNDAMLPSGVYVAYLKTPTTQEALKLVITR